MRDSERYAIWLGRGEAIGRWLLAARQIEKDSYHWLVRRVRRLEARARNHTGIAPRQIGNA